MLRALIIMLVATALLWAVRRAVVAVRAYMRGELADGFPTSRRPRSRQRWKVVQEENEEAGTTIIRVEHPRDGVRRTWTVDMSADEARRELVRVRADAEALASELNGE